MSDGTTKKRQVETVSTSPPETPKKAPSSPAKAARQMDKALRLANKLDAILEQMSPWAREWALKYLLAKYPFPQTDADVPPLA
jgi:hypothetical protein